MVYGRITPACAGNSQSEKLGLFAEEDHPRVCGEQFVFASRLDRERGSPPRVRGTALENLLDKGTDGITPACAGNSERGNHQYDNG